MAFALLLALQTAVAPGQDVWGSVRLHTGEKDEYRRGEGIVVRVSVSRPAYAIVLRADTDGRVTILYPAAPSAAAPLRPDVPFALVRAPNTATFVVDEYPGVGYLVAMASERPFELERFWDNGRWRMSALLPSGRITGDPYATIAMMAGEIVPPDARYAFDVVPYYVGRRYAYPRYICFSCHEAVGYPVWDPYRDWCGTFRAAMEDLRPGVWDGDPRRGVVFPPMVRPLSAAFPWAADTTGAASQAPAATRSLPPAGVRPVPRDAAQVSLPPLPAYPRPTLERRRRPSRPRFP